MYFLVNYKEDDFLVKCCNKMTLNSIISANKVQDVNCQIRGELTVKLNVYMYGTTFSEFVKTNTVSFSDSETKYGFKNGSKTDYYCLRFGKHTKFFDLPAVQVAFDNMTGYTHNTYHIIDRDISELYNLHKIVRFVIVERNPLDKEGFFEQNNENMKTFLGELTYKLEMQKPKLTKLIEKARKELIDNQIRQYELVSALTSEQLNTNNYQIKIDGGSFKFNLGHIATYCN